MYNAIYLSPMIPSKNIEETKRFFVDLFGFEIVRGEDYIIIKKDNHLIHILHAGIEIDEMEFYLEVDHIDALWDSIKDRLTGIKMRPPFDRDYGMREFHVVVPHTNTLMFVGQSIQ
jgi:catechol 2,3-dioxygenase-like lactoylglutathione lyase family enzyme